MKDTELDKLVLDPGIIRHRGKIFSVRQNARAWLAIDEPVEWLWSFVGGEAEDESLQKSNRFSRPVT